MDARCSLFAVIPLALTGCETLTGIQDTVAIDAGVSSAPDAADLEPARVLSAQVTEFHTDSTEFVDVEDSEIAIQPRDSTDVWVVLISAQLSTPFSSSGRGVEARYTVNDTVRGVGGIENSAPDAGGSWQHFYVIRDVSDAQVVKVQLKNLRAQRSAITNLSVVAFALPPGTDWHYEARDTNTPVTRQSTEWMSHIRLPFRPQQRGWYLSLLLATLTEMPGVQTIGARWIAPDGSVIPEGIGSASETHSHFSNSRGAWQSFFTARITELAPEDQEYDMQLALNSPESTVPYARMLVFSLDRFTGFRTSQVPELASYANPTPQLHHELPGDGPPSQRPHIAIQSARVHNQADPCEPRQIEFRIDGAVKQEFAHCHENSSYRPSYGHFDASLTGPITLETFASGSAQTPLRVSESVLHVLQL